MSEQSLAPKLEDAKKYLEVTQDESEAVSRLVFPSDRRIYDNFVESGIRVDRVQPGFVVCTFKVPPRLTDRAGNLANGAIASLVDMVGASTVFVPHIPMNVSVDMSISYMAKAKLNDELEITSKRLGQRGRYSGTCVLLRNKASGEIIAEDYRFREVPMEKAKRSLELNSDESETVSRVAIPALQIGKSSVHDFFAVRVFQRMRGESLAPIMEDAKKYLEVTQDESEAVSRLVFPSDRSIYDHFVESGIRVDRVQPGFVVCTFKVPPRLTDRAGNLANGAIATLVDVVGASTVLVPHIPMTVSVDMSISYMAKAKLNDELEITSKRLGQRGRYYGTYVLLRNKASGEIIAEGRHSLFRPSSTSKL